MKHHLAWLLIVMVNASALAQQPAGVVAEGQRGQERLSTDAVALLKTPVTIRLDRVTVSRALDVVAASAKVRIAYNQRVVDASAKRVTLTTTNTPLGTTLDQVLAGTTLQLRVLPGPRLTVVDRETAGPQATPATGGITGRIVDSANGRGLSGAAVKVQRTKLAALTNDNGEFTLRDVPAGDQLLSIRLFGYRPATRPVTVPENGQVTVRIVMSSVPTVLSGVVTTATGVQQKREVGNDIVTLNVDSIQQVAPITSVTDLLESRVPGLTVLHSSGVPGDPSRLRLRGPKSITGSNDPIVIVDGIRVYAQQSDARTANLAGSAVLTTALDVGNSGDQPGDYSAPSPLDQVDPNSIETIEVLKGPSASSLYGSDAANGVIVITTKRGRAGPTHWSTTVGQGLSYLPGDYPVQTLRWAHATFGETESHVCGIEFVLFCSVVDSVTHFQVLNLPHWSPFGHGGSTSGNISVSGGSATLTYALTGSASTELGYLRLPGALSDAFKAFHGYDAPGWAKRPDKYMTWGSGGQLTALPTPTVQLTFSSTLFHGTQQRSSLEQMLPLLVASTDTNLTVAYKNVGIRYANAYERVTDEQLTFNNALNASWAPWAWLPLTGAAGLNITTGHDVSLLPRNYVPYGSNSNFASDTLGRYGVAQKSATMKTLTINTIIPGWRGKLKTAMGVNIYTQSSTDVVAHEDTLGLGLTEPSVLRGATTLSATGISTFGWFFEPRMTLGDRLFVTPGFRLDGGNANGERATVAGLPAKLTFAALFPKVNVSWVALERQSDEPPVLGMLTVLRPRFAIGAAGVQPNPGDQLRLLRVVNGDTLGVQTLGNTQLRPERSSELEGGFEAELWQGRVVLDVTRARQLRRDAIIRVPVAPSVVGEDAEAQIAINIGEIRNISTELSASVHPIETPMLSWTIGGNLSHNDNVVLKLDRNNFAQIFLPNGQRRTDNSVTVADGKIAVGYPLFGRWAQPILGYADINGDGIIETDEIRLGDTAVYLGRNDPAYTAALTTDLTFLRGTLGVHADISRQGGFSQVNAAGASGTFLTAANEPAATFGQQAAYVAATKTMTYYGLVQTVTSWKFQSLSINYTVLRAIAQRFRARRMSVALQGSNLGLWSNYRGKDPNVNAFPNGNSTLDNGQLPQPRTWTIKLSLGN